MHGHLFNDTVADTSTPLRNHVACPPNDRRSQRRRSRVTGEACIRARILLSRGNLVSSRVSVPHGFCFENVRRSRVDLYSLSQAFLQLNGRGRLTYGTALVALRRSHTYQFRDRSVASVSKAEILFPCFGTERFRLV